MTTGSLTDGQRETLAVFERAEAGTPVTTNEVADALDLGRRSAYERLDRLADRGLIATKKVGASGRVWWRPREAAAAASSAGAADRDGDGAGQFESLVDAVEEYAIFLLDAEGRVASWNAGATRIKGYDADEIVGEEIGTFYTPADRRAGVPGRNLADAAADGSVEDEGWRVRADGSRFWANVTITALRGDGGELRGYAKVTRDMTERREHEQALRRERDELESELDELFGRVTDAFFGLDGDRRFTYVNERAGALLGHDPADLVGERLDDVPGLGDLLPRERYERAMADQEVRSFEERYAPGEAWFEVRVYPSETGLSVYFHDVTERTEREREVEAQREHLAALNHLNGVVHEITDAVIDRSTREEIERTVCEALAASSSYAFAWIGETDPGTDTVRLRTEAGVEGYLDAVRIAVDPDDPEGNGPTATAIRTGEMQVVADAREDYDVAAWREHAEQYGFRSSASIPIAHEGVLYGVLNVYARRPGAFAGEERAVVGRLGEVVGHAIAAVERKRALTSDQVHEIDFRIADVFSALDIPAAATDRITLDQAVPIGDGEHLVYGTATDEDVAVVDTIVDSLDTWRSVRVVGSGFGRTKFELLLSESSILNGVASRNGYVVGAWIEDGDYHMTVQLPHGADVRAFTDAVLASYPVAELRAQRQVRRSDDGPNRMVSAVEAELTDRQRTALETAHFAGYFEWPRESNGGELADVLGISAPTFSQHLRAAEKKVFEALFDSLAATG